MKHNLLNNSIVILGNVHNPSLISDFFLKETNIIEKKEDLNRTNIIITPAFSQFIIKNKVTFLIEPPKLKISSTEIIPEPFEYATKYCEGLPYIKSNGIGINFGVEVSDYNFTKWFNDRNKTDIPNSKITTLTLSNEIDKYVTCNITFKQNFNKNVIADFNFHHAFNEVALSEIKFDFVEKWKEYRSLISKFLEKIFN